MPFTNPMRRASAPTATLRDLDLELQAGSALGEESHRHRFTTSRLSRPPYPGSSSSTEKSSPQLPDGVHGEDNHRHAERTLNNPAQSEPDWKPWKLNDPYLTEVPQDEQAMEKWVEAMKESDDGMCRGWTDQIDTLIIFAGLFSATVTAFTIESYRWLEETQADMVARLQLRALLNAAHDPAVDLLAPTTFRISPSSVLINTFWFASLTLALGAVVVSILCKQWLYEYQRYENLTVKEIFLIRGLRYRGLKACLGIISCGPSHLAWSTTARRCSHHHRHSWIHFPFYDYNNDSPLHSIHVSKI
ncbi:hypothetical protein BDZ94DRAFT_1037163 [Collybia nuda]|uniref:DUF6535 domain-containing protein n=1 Tax=Collybia nuda TaxID=64659 RepID=A0A9P6CMK7_9AGAR|nr:hypothetical protein BDZ94DRAFT_1037163 [Collybia nuda]